VILVPSGAALGGISRPKNTSKPATKPWRWS